MSQATAARARAFIQDFLYPNARSIFNGAAANPADEHAKWIAGFILAKRKKALTERDVYRSYFALKPLDRRHLIGVAMRTLEFEGWVEPKARLGKPANEWTVNSAVHDGRFESIADAERKRRDEARRAISLAVDARRDLGGAAAA